MGRYERSELGAVGQWLLVLSIAALPALFSVGACSSEPAKIQIPRGDGTGSGGSGAIVDTPADIARCGSDGITCGDGCCPAGNSCSEFGRCIPVAECTDGSECTSDSTCAQGTCQPWDVLPDDFRYNRACRDAVDLPSVVPTVQCQWPGPTPPAVEPTMVQVIGTPMVVDFNSDGDPSTSHPSIVFISYTGAFNNNTGVIRVIDGKTCQLQDTIQGQFPFTPEVPLALGDINNDGKPDIIAADEEKVGAATKSGIAVFELAGSGPTPKFRPMQNGRVQSAGTAIIKGFALYDIDDDDYPEIFTEKTMLHFDVSQAGLVDVSAVQLTGRPELTMIEPPTVADLDGDHIAEVVTPQGIYSWDSENKKFIDKTRGAGGTALWNPGADDAQGAFLGLANLEDWPTGLPGAVDSAELVVVGHNGKVWVRTVDGQVRYLMQTPGLAGGPPVIADLDGDGRMEFASGGIDKVTVFDLDCTTSFFNERGCENGRGEARPDGVIWEGRVQGAQSGLAVFDFDGDGRSEVVYADQCFMRVYDGRTGKVLFSTPRMSTTQYEYPVVADTDGDGSSKIVTTSNDNDTTVTCPATDPENDNATVPFEATHGVTVWAEKSNRWAGSRPIWNQHNYYITNVNDDGTIPKMSEVENHWEDGPNTFRQNVQGSTGRSLSLADVTTAGVPTVDCDERGGSATVTIDLCNRGSIDIPTDQTEIALVREDAPTTVLCQERNGEAIRPGGCISVSCTLPVTPRADPFNLVILGDPTDQVRECSEGNNRSLISRVSCGGIIQ